MPNQFERVNLCYDTLFRVCSGRLAVFFPPKQTSRLLQQTCPERLVASLQ